MQTMGSISEPGSSRGEGKYYGNPLKYFAWKFPHEQMEPGTLLIAQNCQKQICNQTIKILLRSSNCTLKDHLNCLVTSVTQTPFMNIHDQNIIAKNSASSKMFFSLVTG